MKYTERDMMIGEGEVKMRVGLVQTESNGTKAENEKKVFEQLNEAVLGNPDVICLSELFLSWGVDFDGGKVKLDEIVKYQDFAEKNNVNLILGSVALESDIPGKVTNTCFVISRKGDIIGRYDKIHMYKVNKPGFRFDESDDTIAGEKLGIFEIDGVKIGIGICFDLRFPEYFRELAERGAQIIFLPSHFNKGTGSIAWEILTRARAIENQVYFCAVNQTGENLCADTKVISYAGEVIKSLGREEGILTMDLELGLQEQHRNEVPMLRQIKIR